MSGILAGVYPPLETGALVGSPRQPGFPYSEPGLIHTHLGRGAVWLALRSLGLGAGKRIAMPAYHCGSEVEAAHLAGLEIDFYRVDGDLRVDEDDMRRVAAGCDATYLISNFGFPMVTPPDGLVVEDAAHALFSRDGAEPIGSRGDAAVFCTRKSLGAPDGGAVLVKDGKAVDSERPRASGRAMARSTVSLAASRAALSRLAPLRAASLRLLAGASVERQAAAEGKLTEIVIGEWDLEVEDMEAAARPPTRLTERIAVRADPEEIALSRRLNYETLLAELGEHVPVRHRELPPGVTPLYLPVMTADRPRAMVKLLDGGVRALEVWPVPHPLLDRERFAELEPARAGLVALPVHQSLRPEHVESVLAAAKSALG